MAFEFLEVATELVAKSKPVLDRLKRHDRDLERQLRRAVSGIPSSIAEGNWRGGKDRPYLFRTAAGSAAESRAHLQTAVAFEYVNSVDIQPPLALIDRLLAIAWRLTHPR